MHGVTQRSSHHTTRRQQQDVPASYMAAERMSPSGMQIRRWPLLQQEGFFSVYLRNLLDYATTATLQSCLLRAEDPSSGATEGLLPRPYRHSLESTLSGSAAQRGASGASSSHRLGRLCNGVGGVAAGALRERDERDESPPRPSLLQGVA